MDKTIWLEKAMSQWEVPLLRTCFLLLGDTQLAEDALQEVFLKAWRGCESFRGEASEKTWLMRIAINTCRDLQRSRWLKHIDRRVNLDELPEGSTEFVADDTVVRAVLSLPKALRQVVVLKYYQEMTISEVMEALGLSRRTVYNRLRKAEKALKCSLEEWYRET